MAPVNHHLVGARSTRSSWPWVEGVCCSPVRSGLPTRVTPGGPFRDCSLPDHRVLVGKHGEVTARFEYQNVRVDGDDGPIVEGFFAVIPAEGLTAIVGPSGAGKT